MLRLRFHHSHIILLMGFFNNVSQTGVLWTLSGNGSAVFGKYWKKCSCTKSEFSSQVRCQQLSACRAEQALLIAGWTLQSCLCSSTANVFYVHSAVCTSLAHTNNMYISSHSVPQRAWVPADSSRTALLSSPKPELKFSLAESGHVSLPMICLRTQPSSSFSWAFLVGLSQPRLSYQQVGFFLVPFSYFNGKYWVLLMSLRSSKRHLGKGCQHVVWNTCAWQEHLLPASPECLRVLCSLPQTAAEQALCPRKEAGNSGTYRRVRPPTLWAKFGKDRHFNASI